MPYYFPQQLHNFSFSPSKHKGSNLTNTCNFVLFCFLIFNWLPPSHYIYTGSRSSSPIDFLSGAQIMPAFFLHWIFCTCWTPIPRKLCHQIFTWLVPCCLLSPSSNTTSSGKSLNKLNPNLIFSHPIQSSPSYKGLAIW